ncbi:MAG: hypothetical protein [Olavius algarvensis Gamma 3 endosymbiont]|nr:MAG: hypothetical protein [Olavius algarvensis Gamma 3 endosymbiont]
MNKTYPCIWLCDIETSIDWYADFLEFNCIFKSPLKKPGFAVIEKDDLKIYLIQSDNPDRYASNTLIIEVDDIEDSFNAAEKAGALILQSVEDGMFGGREFIIKDYEDNKLIYHQSA